MSLLKQIPDKGAVLAWSPVKAYGAVLATGTKVSAGGAASGAPPCSREQHALLCARAAYYHGRHISRILYTLPSCCLLMYGLASLCNLRGAPTLHPTSLPPASGSPRAYTLQEGGGGGFDDYGGELSLHSIDLSNHSLDTRILGR